MNDVSLNYVHCPDTGSGHRMAYWQWGDAATSHTVVCAHGLSRQGRDFDVLAKALCSRAEQQGSAIRVVCPDVAGRGQSDWLQDPNGYQLPTYAADMLAMLAQLHQQAPLRMLDWVGTSMGGLIGMVLCGQPGLLLPVPVRKLVLNDIGPAIQWSAIQRIASYVGQAGQFASLQQAVDALWAISKSFGPHTPQQWMELSRPMLRAAPGAAENTGPYTLHYDPAIAVPFRAATEVSTQEGEALLWKLYDHISAQTLLLRGAESDLLSKETALAMTQRGPRASLKEFPGVGHAPTLIAADQIAVVADFLFA